jgi:hypothetical protein
MRNAVLLAAVAAAAVAIAGGIGAGSAKAYGPGSVAQIEISGNCNNPSYCDTAFGGTGGLWIWASLNPGGSTDFTFNGCGHSVGGGGGPQSGNGGGPRGVPGNGSWTIAPNLFAALSLGAFPLDVAVSNGAPADVPYYVLYLSGGFIAAAPVPVGHYSTPGLSFIFGPTPPGVSFQTQVAP